MNKDTEFLKLYAMQFFYIASHVFSWTLSTLYFLNKGYTPADIALYFGVSFITSLITIRITNEFHSKQSMQLGIVMKMLVFLLAAWLVVKPMIFVVSVVWGIMTVLYWVPLNIHFFKYKTEGKNAAHSGLYFLMWPLLSAILPAAAGVAADKFGMTSVLIAGAALLIPAVILSFKVSIESSIAYNLADFVGNTKGIKTIIFLQGIWEGVDWTVAPIVTFAFIPAETNYGAFYSYIGFFGVIAFLLLAKASDKAKKRAVFLYPIAITLALFTILSGLSGNLLEWGLYRGAVSFLVNLFSPFAMTVVVDVSKNIADSMISREFFLNYGRATGAAIVLATITYFGSANIKYAFIISGLILLTHPLFLRLKKKGYHVEI